jgi:hypothetical protein
MVAQLGGGNTFEKIENPSVILSAAKNPIGFTTRCEPANIQPDSSLRSE